MNVFRSVMAVAAAVAIVVPARGGLHIGWAASGGFVPDAENESVGILSPGYNPSGSVLAQLIFTLATGPSPAFGGPVDHPDYRADFSSGADEVLQSITLTRDSNTEFGTFTATYIDPVFRAGNVFVRIFGASQSQIDVGTPYYDGPLWATEFRDMGPPLAAQQVIAANENTLAGGLGDALDLELGVIPEPNTVGLLAIGGLAAYMRRRRFAA